IPIIRSVGLPHGCRPRLAAATTYPAETSTAQGGGVVFVCDGAVASALPAPPPQPGGVAAVGKYAAVADVQGNGVWVYDASTRQLVAQRPVGVKLTHAVALSDDLV